MNAPALMESADVKASVWQRMWGSRRLLVACLSPIFMWTLFYGQASGSITNAVEMANQRYGNDLAYQDYVENVPLIIPNPLKWFVGTSK